MVSYRYLVILILGGFLNDVNLSANLHFKGIEDPVMEIVPEKSTGIDKIYILKSLSHVSAYIDTYGSKNVFWSIYDKLGGGYAQAIDNIINSDGKSVLSLIKSDSGYIIEIDNKKYVYWIVDYSMNPFIIDYITYSDDQDCESTQLTFSGNGSPIYYYTIDGQRKKLSRDIKISYYNLNWDRDKLQFIQHENIHYLEEIDEYINIIPPLYCKSDICIYEDRFQKFWKESSVYRVPQTNLFSVMVETKATQINYDTNIDNLIKDEKSILGGSAPCTINFESYISDGVEHVEWQISDDPEFNNISHRITQQDFEYTFQKEGSTYIRCIASNADGSCESYSEVYHVSIGNSELRIPNVFSPNGDGINDEWKIIYRSLIEFKCWIYDSHGHEIYYFNDPSKGWNGYYAGKPVNPGVYYYIIKAIGSDGKCYNKSGDINIISKRK